jgi:uncharacterized protein (DUF885 family)
MLTHRTLSLLLAGSLLALPVMAAPMAPATQTSVSASTAFHQLSEQYFKDYFANSPSYATYLGIHDHDQALEDYSLAGIQADIKSSQTYFAAFSKINPKALSPDDAMDYELLLNALQSSLLEAQTIRNWEKNPDIYSSGITESVFTLMSRSFAPPETRLRSVIERQKKMPMVFAAARANLKNPPKVFTEVAIDQLPGLIDFFAKDVPAAFSAVKDAKLLAEFKDSNAGVIKALQDYEDWLKADLLPRSKGDFRLGAETYQEKLLYDEMVDIPLKRLLEIGYADLRKNQQHFKATGLKLDPKRSPAEILERLNHDYPPPKQLLQNFRDVMGGMRDFIVSRKIITLPSLTPPRVEETPPFMRALTFASMDTPGPFENVAKEAYFNVTLPEFDWKPEEVAEHMAGFNYGTIVSTAIHEAYPGHYIQFLWAPKWPSKARKILGAASNSEGWAHYCEQMMLDEGYGNNDPKLRLGQLQDALLRNARYIVGIGMHTGQMSFEQGVQFFMKEGYQTRTNAERETMRGTSDPTYLYYTLGKLQINKLREDYKKLRGKNYSLQEFHDRFIKQGTPPIKLVRRMMLGNNSPVL